MPYVARIRSVLGKSRIILVYATVILHRGDRVLMQRRADFDVWGLPGGVLEYDEDIVTCARRELREETGLEAGPLSLVGVYTDPIYAVTYPNGDEVQQYTVCLKGEFVGGILRADMRETSRLAFLSPTGFIDGATMTLPWYSAMLRDHRAGGPPAYEPPRRAVAESQAVDYPDNAIIAGAVAVVRRDDGRLLLVEPTSPDGARLPAAATCLGENAATTAVRAVAETAEISVRPERILGIAGSPDLDLPLSGRINDRFVGAVFLCRTSGRGDPGSDGNYVWVEPDALVSTGSTGVGRLHRLVVEHLGGGCFLA